MNHVDLKSGTKKLAFDKQQISRLTNLAVQAANEPDTRPTTNISYIADCFSAIAFNCPGFPTTA